MENLHDRVAVVTGAGSGIGRALAERFAGEGMRLVPADVEEAPLALAAEELRTAGAKVITVPTDVSRPDQVEALAERSFHTFGAVHVLCNNAGVGGGGLSWEASLQDWEWVLGVNLWGVVHGVRAFVPRMIAGGEEGHVVNTASVAGLLTAPGMGPYNVSKFGVVALSETMHQEFAAVGTKLRVSVLCPAWVRTRINESERNRPAGLEARPTSPQTEAMRQMVGALLDAGMDPADVAAQVVDAIRAGRFYVLTHPDFTPLVRARMEGLLEGRNPGRGELPG